MSRKKSYLVYHYELMNDGRKILIFEPNIFYDIENARIHAGCLNYLGNVGAAVIPESECSNIPLFLNE